MARRGASFPYLGALIFALLAPRPAAAQFAQYQEWRYQCVPGSFQACVSVRVGISYPDGEFASTAFTVWVRNLQGAEAWLPDPGPYGFFSFSLYAMTVTDAPESSWTYNQDPVFMGGEGGAQIGSSHFGVFADPDMGFFGAGVHAYDLLWGCDVPDLDPENNIVPASQTCPGSARMDVTLDGYWAFDDATLVTLTAASQGTEGLITTHSCVVGQTCMTPVPEPATYIMLGTGLLALGFVYRRRGRKPELAE